MEEKDFYRLLVQRYIKNEATDRELEAFFQLLNEGKLDEYLSEEMASADPHNAAGDMRKKKKIITLRRLAAAAVIISVFCLGGYLLLNRGNQPTTLAHVQHGSTHDSASLLPGSDKAVLILGDGSRILLNSESNGELAQQNGTKIIKLNEQLVYDPGTTSAGEVSYNTIVTPKGGQYQIVLSDGTKVWLNAASTLRFPTAFIHNERRVEISGEGYFEVAQNLKPFIVQKQAMEIKVLGTHFNVNAYDDEPDAKITLLEGSVRISKNDQTALLKPGEQARVAAMVSDAAPVSVEHSANVEQAVAWKNGVFQFEGEDIRQVMRQLTRWYDAEIEYHGAVDQHFRGTVSRYADVDAVLEMLSLTGTVHFKTEGKKIIVNP